MTAVLAPTAFPALGTTAVLLVTEPAVREEGRRLLEAEIDAVDRACSRFRDDSELAAVNAAAGRPVRVSALLLKAVDVARRAAVLTGGLVDPTVGSALRVLGYDRDFAQVHPAGPPVRVTIRPVPGWRLVWTDHATSTVRVPAGVELDLGATAKALCADRAADRIHELTGSGTLVSLGGDIAMAGPPPSGGWPIRVTDHHDAPPDAPGETITLESGGLATSGVTARRWQRGGRALHHLIDPARGVPADSCWRTVSVVAGSCVDANIASTAAIIMGAAAPGWLRAHHLPARLVATDGPVVHVAGWPDEDEPSPC